jgi:hypothetical protein
LPIQYKWNFTVAEKYFDYNDPHNQADFAMLNGHTSRT